MELKETNKFQSNYHQFKFDCDNTDTLKLFVSSDWHFDNPKCNRKLLFSHLDKAMEMDAKIVVTGDLFCFMQGKYDPRGSKSDILPEHNKNNYLDAVINDTAEKLIPYAKNILLISRGNHETSVSRRAETDVMERFVERLNLIAGSNIQIGNYTGYYSLQFKSNNANRRTLNVGYSHGNWGGIITKGTLSVVRMACMMPDADLIFSGHTHDGWIMPQPRLVRNEYKKTVEVKNQWHIKTGTYKEEFAGGKGWAVERIGMPKYLGGCFLDITYNSSSDIKFEATLTH
jgi:predicted MPP superfamily phosphohydrolase